MERAAEEIIRVLALLVNAVFWRDGLMMGALQHLFLLNEDSPKQWPQHVVIASWLELWGQWTLE